MTEKKLVVSDLDESRQSFVLAMVHGNLMPENIAKDHSWFGKTQRGGFDCLSNAGYQQLCDLESKGFKESADKARAITSEHWKAWAKNAAKDLLTPQPAV